jgi:1-phosphatidylinositol phosphodiesterase
MVWKKVISLTLVLGLITPLLAAKTNSASAASVNYRYEAEGSQVSHATGRNDGDGWLCQCNIDSANLYMVYGPYATNIPAGQNRAYFRMKVDNNTADNNNVAEIDVRDATTGNVLVSQNITRQQFTAASTYQTFCLFYNETAGDSLEFRVYWYGTSYLKVDYVGDQSIAYTNSNWMGSISDSVNLTSLSIPGTHESGALYEPVSGTAKCQSLSIADQLNAGARFLDIRCRHIDNAFAIHHGSIYQNENFDDVLNACYSFLNANPTETIIMSVKEEYDESNCTETFEQTFDDYVAKNPSKWYLSDVVPQLGAVRGKIVLVRRFDATSTPKGINCSVWPDNTTFTASSGGTTIKVQDYYNDSSASAKWTNVQPILNEAKSQNSSWLYINFTSGYYSILGIPSITTISNYVNPLLTSYFTANVSGRFGIIPMDFVDSGKCSQIISTNFSL